jgi:hypothetical protein
MPTTTAKDEGWSSVSELCSRLRTIQADTAELSAERRRDFLREEITRSLQGASPPNRKPLLEAVLARFPVGGEVPATAVTPAATPAPETFADLQERFLNAVGKLPPEKRAEVTRTLEKEGLAAPVGGGTSGGLPPELSKALNLALSQEPSAEQLGRLCVLLLEVLQRLDQTALATLRELAPKSPLLKKRDDIRTPAAQYLAGRPELLESQVRHITTLLGALMAGFLGGGRDFGRQYVDRLSPPAIEDVVRSEGSSSIFGRNIKERCWDKYVLLAKDFETPEVVDRRIRDCLAAFIESKVLGGR